MRIFIADQRRQPDPDPNLTIEQVRDLLADFLPELSNASWTAQPEGEDTIIVFTKRVGTKGTVVPLPHEGYNPVVAISLHLRDSTSLRWRLLEEVRQVEAMMALGSFSRSLGVLLELQKLSPEQPQEGAP